MKKFSNILLVVDADSEYVAGLDRAVALARSNQAALTVCGVIAEASMPPLTSKHAIISAEIHTTARAENRERLEAAVAAFREDALSLNVTIRVGRPFVGVILQVLENGHDLVIKCAERGGIRNTLFGSTDMSLMRKCPCPVWIINASKQQQYRGILAAVDKESDVRSNDLLNREILDVATSLALAEFSELHIVHAWRLLGESHMRSARVGLSDAEVDEIVSEEENQRRHWLRKLVNADSSKDDEKAIGYLKPKLHLVKGDAKRIIPSTARELKVDLVVMGSIARSGIPGFFMGNTAESILNQIDCSVLTIKPPGFVSPLSQ